MTTRNDIIRIYDVSTDVNRFQYLLPDASTFTTVFDGSSRAKTWTPPSVFSLKPTREEPDFMDFGMGGNGAVWAIRPEAFQCAPELHHYLYAAGELLPLNYNGRNFQLLNVTEVLNALDTERTTWDYYDDGTRADIEKPAFRSDRLSEQSSRSRRLRSRRSTAGKTHSTPRTSSRPTSNVTASPDSLSTS